MQEELRTPKLDSVETHAKIMTRKDISLRPKKNGGRKTNEKKKEKQMIVYN